MNTYKKIQIDNARNSILMLKGLIATSAAMDDGKIDRKEKREIEAVIKAADRFLKDTDFAGR